MAKASAMSAAGPEPEWRMGDRQLITGLFPGTLIMCGNWSSLGIIGNVFGIPKTSKN